MNARNLKITLVGLALIVAGTVAVSQTVKRTHWEHDGMFGGPGLGFLAHRLDLTEEQRAQAKEILAKEKPTIQPLLQQLALTRHQLRQFAEGGIFDEAQVRAIAGQQGQTLTELTVQKARIEAELVKILTPEQKTKLTQMMDRREQRMQRFTQAQQPVESQ
jgi:Spy/CpxP family protein refolding chaperone